MNTINLNKNEENLKNENKNYELKNVEIKKNIKKQTMDIIDINNKEYNTINELNEKEDTFQFNELTKSRHFIDVKNENKKKNITENKENVNEEIVNEKNIDEKNINEENINEKNVNEENQILNINKIDDPNNFTEYVNENKNISNENDTINNYFKTEEEKKIKLFLDKHIYKINKKNENKEEIIFPEPVELFPEEWFQSNEINHWLIHKCCIWLYNKNDNLYFNNDKKEIYYYVNGNFNRFDNSFFENIDEYIIVNDMNSCNDEN